jgi:hypothetical protein
LVFGDGDGGVLSKSRTRTAKASGPSVGVAKSRSVEATSEPRLGTRRRALRTPPLSAWSRRVGATAERISAISSGLRPESTIW